MFVPKDPEFEARVRSSFARQTLMRTIGAEIASVEPGRCEIAMRSRPDLCQQHGFVHAGITTTLADTAAGYAAYSLMPAGSSVLTVEFKVNLLAPAVGERLVARAVVERAGKTLSVVRSEVLADGERPVALMQATMMCMRDMEDADGAAGPGRP